jgi:hypothetical protein
VPVGVGHGVEAVPSEQLRQLPGHVNLPSDVSQLQEKVQEEEREVEVALQWAERGLPPREMGD